MIALVAALVVVSTGAMLLVALGAPRRSLPFWAEAYVVGFCVLGTGGFLLCRLAHLSIRTGTIVVFVVLLAAMVLAVVRRGWRMGRPRTGLPRLLAAIILVVTASLFLEACVRPLSDWDGRTFWMTKARVFLAAQAVTPPQLKDQMAGLVNPRYPPLAPLTIAGLASVLGIDLADDRAVRPLYVLFLPAILFLLFAQVRLVAGRIAASATMIALLCAPQVTYLESGGAAGAYADLPLASLLAVGAWRALRRPRTLPDGFLLGLVLAGLVLCKEEGRYFAIVILVAALLSFGWTTWRRPSRLLALSIAGVLVIATMAALHAWQQEIPPRLTSPYAELLTARRVLEGLADRGAFVFKAIAIDTFSGFGWRYALWGIPLVLFLRREGHEPRVAGAATLTLLGCAAVPMAGYIVGPYEPGGLIETTWSRFLLQVVAPLAWLMGVGVAAALPRRVVARSSGPLLSVRTLVLVVAIFGISMGAIAVLRRWVSREPVISLEVPSERGTVHGDLWMTGWQMSGSEGLRFSHAEVDGKRRASVGPTTRRRSEVELLFAHRGAEPTSGFAVHVPSQAGDNGVHRVALVFETENGHQLRVERHIQWYPGKL